MFVNDYTNNGGLNLSIILPLLIGFRWLILRRDWSQLGVKKKQTLAKFICVIPRTSCKDRCEKKIIYIQIYIYNVFQLN